MDTLDETSFSVVEPEADLIAEKPIRNDQIDIVILVYIKAGDFETQRIIVENRKHI